MTRVTKWALAAAVLAVALIVALLPRGGGDTAAKPAEDLGPARTAAALQPCPAPGSGPPVKQLEGVKAECLGDGASVDVGQALAGAPVLVNVWASWCQPCRTELPVLQDYAKQPGAVRVLGVQVQSPAKDGLDLLARLGVHLPSVFDGDGGSGPVRTALKVPSALPASYLVTAGGEVRFIANPRTFGNTDQVRAAVEGAS
ncbi:TlpA disulfide reductase family protein [Amycolatopsis sp. SID8362]|uniref:TlpA family protein disulfide reductase n=1 Tax=Amycolatopsis sp. SID8362 TaxID=2690346 RepID=UPI0013691A32|nr:TlpA disulfide reductase family protein [Amycolatopsis sp. SID8362]NBH08019.1 redoxin family protein [Amycolatopsis sp. SID8362]NED44713.1 TlpA family protein disulfide reductase [Amycolatopsis sp. SID8362]